MTHDEFAKLSVGDEVFVPSAKRTGVMDGFADNMTDRTYIAFDGVRYGTGSSPWFRFDQLELTTSDAALRHADSLVIALQGGPDCCHRGERSFGRCVDCGQDV